MDSKQGGLFFLGCNFYFEWEGPKSTSILLGRFYFTVKQLWILGMFGDISVLYLPIPDWCVIARFIPHDCVLVVHYYPPSLYSSAHSTLGMCISRFYHTYVYIHTYIYIHYYTCIYTQLYTCILCMWYVCVYIHIHPASRGVAAHTAGLFRSVRGAKGGFPPWGLFKLRSFNKKSFQNIVFDSVFPMFPVKQTVIYTFFAIKAVNPSKTLLLTVFL